jgi:hypothetical protein
MNKGLSFQDFDYVLTDENGNGYYSFRQKNFEICVDKNTDESWEVLFANKFEEVLKEKKVSNENQALEVAREIYKKLPNM